MRWRSVSEILLGRQNRGNAEFAGSMFCEDLLIMTVDRSFGLHCFERVFDKRGAQPETAGAVTGAA